MRQLYLCLFLFTLFSTALDAKLYEGYIITKSDIALTGFIGNINHSNQAAMVEFVNDFGTPYILHPALIKGFVLQEGPIFHYYESKLWRNKWLFLRVVFPGEELRLLQAPEEQLSYRFVDGEVNESVGIQQVEYWLEISGKRVMPIKRIGFRKRIRRLINDVSPTLADQIGQPGYRYRDLYAIVKEYNLLCERGTRRL